MMCAQMGPKGMASAKCDTMENGQLYRMERLSSATFKGKKNAKNAVGTFRLHSRADDGQCVTWAGSSACATYSWTACKKRPRGSDNQVFHVSKFTDDDGDADVFNWAGANGKALSAAGCKGYTEGNSISHCADNLNQAKRWQMLVSNIPLTTFRANLGSFNGVSAKEYQFQIAALTSKSGKYSALMRKQCKSYGMRPVW